MQPSEEMIIVQVSFVGLEKTGIGTRSYVVPAGDGREQGIKSWDACQDAAKDALKDIAPEFVAYLNEKQNRTE